MFGFVFNVAVFYLAVAGAVMAVFFGLSRWTLYLIAPALLRAVWPSIASTALPLFEQVSWWEKAVALPVVILFLFFAAIKVLQITIGGLFGSSVSARVTAHAILATFRVIGRIIAFVFAWPRRAFKNRRDMDELLRQWRRR